MLGAGGSRLLNLVAAVAIARHIGAEDFGRFALVQTTTVMLASFGSAGLGLTAAKHIAELRGVNPRRAGAILSLVLAAAGLGGAVFSICLYGFAGPISIWLGSPSLESLLRVASVTVMFSALLTVLVGTLNGLEAFKGVALLGAFGALAYLVFGTVGALLHGIGGAVLGIVLATGCSCALGCAFTVRETHRQGLVINVRAAASTEKRLLWSFSLPAALAALMTEPVNWLSVAMLAHARGLVDVAMFNAANQWRLAVLFVPGAVAGSVFPIMASLHGTRSRDQFSQLLWATSVVTATIGGVVALGVISLAAPIMRLFGAQFAGGRLALVILVVSAVFAVWAGVMGQALTSTRFMWAAFYLNLLWAGTLFVCAVPLRHFGAAGLAGAYLISYAALAAATTVVVRRAVTIDYSLSDVVREICRVPTPLSRLLGFSK